jgi:hypothetical protein
MHSDRHPGIGPRAVFALVYHNSPALAFSRPVTAGVAGRVLLERLEPSSIGAGGHRGWQSRGDERVVDLQTAL